MTRISTSTRFLVVLLALVSAPFSSAEAAPDSGFIAAAPQAHKRLHALRIRDGNHAHHKHQLKDKVILQARDEPVPTLYVTVTSTTTISSYSTFITTKTRGVDGAPPPTLTTAPKEDIVGGVNDNNIPSGGQDNDEPPQLEPKRKSKTPLIAGLVSTFIILGAASTLGFLFYRRKQIERREAEEDEAARASAKEATLAPSPSPPPTLDPHADDASSRYSHSRASTLHDNEKHGMSHRVDEYSTTTDATRQDDNYPSLNKPTSAPAPQPAYLAYYLPRGTPTVQTPASTRPGTPSGGSGGNSHNQYSTQPLEPSVAKLPRY